MSNQSQLDAFSRGGLLANGHIPHASGRRVADAWQTRGRRVADVAKRVADVTSCGKKTILFSFSLNNVNQFVDLVKLSFDIIIYWLNNVK